MKIKLKNYQIIISEMLLVIIVYITINTKIYEKLTKCYIREKTHLLCPGCGGTRCIQSLFRGDIISAFKYHPIVTLVVIYLLICNMVYLINRKRKDKKILTWIYPKYYYTVILAIILVVFTILRNIL